MGSRQLHLLLVPFKDKEPVLMFRTADVWGTPEDENSSILFQPTPSITIRRWLNGYSGFIHRRKHMTSSPALWMPPTIL